MRYAVLCLDGHVAAVDDDVGAVDVRRIVRGEIGHRLGDIIGLADPLEGRARDPGFAELGGPLLADALASDKSGLERVDANHGGERRSPGGEQRRASRAIAPPSKAKLGPHP